MTNKKSKKKTKKSRRNEERLQDLPNDLRGPPNNRYGGHQTSRLRGFKDWSRGAASAGTRFSQEQLEAYAKKNGFKVSERRTNPDNWRYTPVLGKRPFLDDWLNHPHTFNEIDYPAYGYGLILGPSSGGVVAIDFDGPLAVDYFYDELGFDLEDDPVCWTSSKTGRCQIAYLVPEKYWEHLNTTKIDLTIDPDDRQGLEFRWAGGQSVLPPSKHPDTGGNYTWINEPTATNYHIIPDKILAFWLDRCNQHTQPQPLGNFRI